MLLNRDNLKLHRIWFVLFALGTVGSLAGLCFSRDGRLFPGGSSLIGIVLGMIAGSIIVFEFLLWPRKKFFRRWRMGRVRTWMCAHIWLGLLTVPMAIIHAGIPWGGTLASATMILLFVVVASGIFGLALQQFLPRMLVDSVREETIFSQIENVLQQYLAEADALVWTTCGGKDEADTAFWSKMYPADFRDDGHTRVNVGARRSIASVKGTALVTELRTAPVPRTEILNAAYHGTVRGFLQNGTGADTGLNQADKSRTFFQDLRAQIHPDAIAAVDLLERWCDQRRQLDRQAMIHHWLHVWLAVHLPLSFALLILLFWHAIVAMEYSGVLSLY